MQVRLTIRVALIAAVILLLASLIAGCGGGEALTAEEIAQHDADAQALAALQTKSTIQTPACSTGACK